MTAEERWADIPGYPGYQASDQGRIRSVDREVVYSNGRRRWYRGRIRKPYYHNGYPYLHLTFNGGNVLVPYLILLAFVGPRPEGLEICHGNDDPTDNRLSNLRYDTRRENCRDLVSNGGTNTQKLRQEDVLNAISRRKAGEKVKDLAREYGVHFSSMSRALNGATFTRVERGDA